MEAWSEMAAWSADDTALPVLLRNIPEVEPLQQRGVARRALQWEHRRKTRLGGGGRLIQSLPARIRELLLRPVQDLKLVHPLKTNPPRRGQSVPLLSVRPPLQVSSE